jgi:hypothetical protein
MIPLVQMHQMVQTPPHLDPLIQPHHLKPDYLSLHHHSAQIPRQLNPYPNVTSTPRAFALRSSRLSPSLPRNPNTFPLANPYQPDLNGEHSLRRKTPNGTLDNGYDGSHLASGPPPLKHMILPASATIFPTAVVDRPPNAPTGGYQSSVPRAGWLYPGISPPNHVHPRLEIISPSGPPAMGAWGVSPLGLGPNLAVMDPSTLLQSIPQPSYHSVESLQPILGPGYHQSSHSPYSPVGYPQPSTWGNVNVSDYRTTTPLANGYPNQGAVVDSALIPPQPTIHPGLSNGLSLGHSHPFRTPLSSHPLDDGINRYSHAQSILVNPQRRLEALSLSPTTVSQRRDSGDAFSTTRFKERVLAHAHKTYADLLIYLSHSKKMHVRSSSGSRSNSKMIVFPKPPKQLTATLSTNPARSSQQPYAEPNPSYPQHMAQKRTLSRPLGYGHRSGDPQVHQPADLTDPAVLSGHAPPPRFPTTIPAEVHSHPSLRHNPYASKTHRILTDVNSPIIGAKSALEMLMNLCEQSGWKWVDGMLLGGCLHYGLEHYEDALEWFKRIISLDERLVCRE